MKHKILTTCFALACSAALLSAQSTPSSGQTDRSTTQTDKSRADNHGSSKGSMTLTGCLQAGTEPNTFMLSNVSESGSQTSSNKSGSQSQANPGSTPSEMARADASYILVPNNKKIDLSKHIGHRVEVTGTLTSDKGSGMHSSQSSSSQGSSGSSSSSSASSSSGTSSGTMGGMSSDMSSHQLKVRSIRQIASSCP